MIAATHLRIPAATHEQNAVLGRVNRLLASRVDVIALSLDATRLLSLPDRAKADVTGNPVRLAARDAREMPYAPPGAGVVRLLIAGGSQGAAILSDVVPKALETLPDDLRGRLRVTQQCRPEDLERVKAFYAEANITAGLATFIEDMPAKLAASHFVISRSGASTVAELTVIGRPAILVPYAFATDDHQTANAQALADAGAAWIMPQQSLTAEALTQRLSALLGDDAALEKAAAAARTLGRPDAAANLADLVEKLAGANGGGGQLDAPRTEKAA
jgi:UDP-N-acetylglucosamine--N-acetylmuramyl-(pentapeptide) pyrophosphoryl-undecaprenol N-acetylglucosamine transferase